MQASKVFTETGKSWRSEVRIISEGARNIIPTRETVKANSYKYMKEVHEKCW